MTLVGKSDALVVLDRAYKALAAITTVVEAKAIRDQAEALRVYAKRAFRGLELQNRCAYIKLLAERRGGELLTRLEREPGKRDGETSFQRELRSAGLAAPTAYRWQVMAAVPDAVLRREWEQADAHSAELTSVAVYRLGKKLRRGRCETDGRGGVRLSFEETYHRLLARIENIPDVERTLGMWGLSRDVLEELLASYQVLRGRVEANIAALKRQIDHEIDTQESGEAQERRAERVSTIGVSESSTA